jgi:GH24 family phage-related lysozyme (muramidase)
VIDQKKIWDHFSRWEVSFPYMYLDSVNVVTVGIGHALFTVEDAEAQSFVYRDDHREKLDGQSVLVASKGQVATKKEIAAEYAKVQLFADKNWAAKSFAKQTLLGLTEDSIKILFTKDVSAKIKALNRILPQVNLYPPDAQLVLLDLIYNGYLVKGRALYKAAKARDWEKAAKLCPKTRNKGRNAYRIGLFHAAAAAEKLLKAKDPKVSKARPRNVSSSNQPAPAASILTPALVRQRSQAPR